MIQSFFNRPTLHVARELLGMRLVHVENGLRIAGTITETEAYVGEEDQACHARAGRTPRTSVMYGPPGRAYVYFTYGMHWLFNCVTEREGFPAAVLVRAIQPTEGLEIIAQRRNSRPQKEWTNGPAKLTQALGINGAHHGLDLCAPNSTLFIEAGDPIPDSNVTTTPRVGLNKVAEPWKGRRWRYLVIGNWVAQSPITNHQSPITNHQSPITNHQSPIYQSPITNLPISIWRIECC